VAVTDDLLAAARSGRVRLALDVTDPEPLPADHELWRTPGVLISPHVGGNSTAFLPRAYRLVAAQVHRFVSGEPLQNVMTRPGTRA
jgi:phosphoglycerate dehydrogenase-like enzyme